MAGWNKLIAVDHADVMTFEHDGKTYFGVRIEGRLAFTENTDFLLLFPHPGPMKHFAEMLLTADAEANESAN